MDSVKIQDKDLKYLTNDPNFNPNRNKSIIDETIKDTENFFAKMDEVKDREAENRVDIISSYGLYRFNKGTKDLEKYLGRQNYNKVIGEKILDKVRTMESVNRLNGNDKYKNSILL